MITAAELRARLVADAALVALLETYDGEPAVFTADPVPSNARLPFVVISPETEDDYGMKNSAGREVRRRIRCYTRATGSTVDVDAIAERVRAVLHRQPFGGAYVVDVTGPEPAPSDPDIYGRALVARALTQED